MPAARLGRRRTRADRGGLSAPRPVAALGRVVRRILMLLGRGVVALVAGGRRHPRWGAALLGVLAVLGLAYFVVRDSSLSAVRRVEVHGISGMDGAAIESSLVAAARHQSTLAVNIGALHAAVARYHLVSGLQVSASFPHTLRITVSEQLPVATLRDGSEAVVVASDGAVLDPSVSAGAAPTLNVASLPSGHVTDPQLLAELTILGAAPPVLLHRVARIYASPNGLTVSMRNGLIIFFGDPARPHAKWISAARVIASPLAVGATYVDVRVPDRPAAGGLTSAASDSATGTDTDATDASIAATLTQAIANPNGVADPSTVAPDPTATDPTDTGAATPADPGSATSAPTDSPASGTDDPASTPDGEPTSSPAVGAGTGSASGPGAAGGTDSTSTGG